MTGRPATCENCDEEWTLVNASDPYPACPLCGSVFDNSYMYKETARELVKEVEELIIFRTNRDMLDFETLKAEFIHQFTSA